MRLEITIIRESVPVLNPPELPKGKQSTKDDIKHEILKFNSKAALKLWENPPKSWLFVLIESILFSTVSD